MYMPIRWWIIRAPLLVLSCAWLALASYLQGTTDRSWWFCWSFLSWTCKENEWRGHAAWCWKTKRRPDIFPSGLRASRQNNSFLERNRCRDGRAWKAKGTPLSLSSCFCSFRHQFSNPFSSDPNPRLSSTEVCSLGRCAEYLPEFHRVCRWFFGYFLCSK